MRNSLHLMQKGNIVNTYEAIPPHLKNITYMEIK
jgi:hypothetical protein